MLETLVSYATRSLPFGLICFVGIAAIKYGFKRFGKAFRIQL
jgi:hypothetical protein